MQRERLVGADLDFPHDFVDVDALAKMMYAKRLCSKTRNFVPSLKSTEQLPSCVFRIDGRRDSDFARVEVLADVAVGENQEDPRGILYQRPDTRGSNVRSGPVQRTGPEVDQARAGSSSRSRARPVDPCGTRRPCPRSCR